MRSSKSSHGNATRPSNTASADILPVLPLSRWRKRAPSSMPESETEQPSERSSSSERAVMSSTTCVWGRESEIGVSGFGFRVSGFGIQVWGLGFQVSVLGLGVCGVRADPFVLVAARRQHEQERRIRHCLDHDARVA